MICYRLGTVLQTTVCSQDQIFAISWSTQKMALSFKLSLLKMQYGFTKFVVTQSTSLQFNSLVTEMRKALLKMHKLVNFYTETISHVNMP